MKHTKYSRVCLQLNPKLAGIHLAANKAAQSQLERAPARLSERCSPSNETCRAAIRLRLKFAALAKAIRHPCRKALAALRCFNISSNQQRIYWKTDPKLALILSASLGAHSLLAEVEELEEFTTVAHAYDTLLSNTGSTVEIIDREDLESGQSTFVLDALREVPGVYVNNNGGPGTVFGITTRGLTDAPVVLIDGIEVSNPASGQIINPGFLFSGSTERIEFLKGPQSSLYGADALAGVISISTLQAKPETTVATASAAYGTFNTFQGSAGIQSNQGAVDYSVNVNYLSSDGFSSADHNAEDDGYTNTSVTAKIGYALTDTVDVYAVAYYIDAETDTDGSIPGDAFGENLNEQIFAKLGAKFQLSEQWNSEANVSFAEIESISIFTDFFGNPSEFVSKGERNEVQWRNVFAVNEAWTVAAGVEYEKEKNRSATGERDETSFYVDSTLAITEALNWSLGGRVDDNSDYGSNSTWRTTGSYQIDALSARIHGSYGTSFKAPTFFETSDPLFGNPDVNPEEGTGWDLGIEFTLAEASVFFDVTYFDNQIEDQIVYDGSINLPFGTYINNAEYQSNGVEISAAWQAIESLLLKANYTYTDAENLSGALPLNVAKNMFNASATWSGLDDRLDVRLSGRYVDERATFSGEVDSSIVVDLAAQYALNETATLWTSVNNLFDEDYQEIAGFNTADFNITAGVRLTF